MHANITTNEYLWYISFEYDETSCQVETNSSLNNKDNFYKNLCDFLGLKYFQNYEIYIFRCVFMELSIVLPQILIG